MATPKVNAALAQILADTLTQSRAAGAHHDANVRQEALTSTMEAFEQEIAVRWGSHFGEFIGGDDTHELLAPLHELAKAPGHQTDFLLNLASTAGLILTILPAAAAGKSSQIRSWSMEKWGKESIGPEAAASGVVRGYIDRGQATEQAGWAGIQPEYFNWLVDMSYSLPSVGAVLAMVNRKLIAEGAGADILHKSGYRQQDIPAIMATRLTPPSTEVALTAELEGNLSSGEVVRIMELNGDDPSTHDWRVETVGQPPPIGEMIRLWRRGKISDGEVMKALVEGPLKLKYIPAVLAMKEVLPSFRQVLNMVGTHILTDAEALDLLIQNGYSPYLAGKMIAYATREKTVKEHDETKAEVVQAYGLRMIDRPSAVALLHKMGITGPATEMILNLADAKRAGRLLDEKASRIRAGYIAWKYDENRARALLDQARIPHEAQDDLLPAWTLEREAQSRHLSPADIKGLVRRAKLTDAEALVKLRAMGYSDEDARHVLELATPIPKH